MSNKLPQLTARQVIYESDWVCLWLDQIEMPDGTRIEKYHHLHFPRESVCVVIVNERQEILMIQSKRALTHALEWEIPAGWVEAHEQAADAAKRECQEETGCTLKELTYLCSQLPNNGMSDLKVHLFKATVESEALQFDQNEVHAKQWMTKEEVLKMLKTNQIRCGISISALLYVFNFSF